MPEHSARIKAMLWMCVSRRELGSPKTDLKSPCCGGSHTGILRVRGVRRVPKSQAGSPRQLLAHSQPATATTDERRSSPASDMTGAPPACPCKPWDQELADSTLPTSLCSSRKRPIVEPAPGGLQKDEIQAFQPRSRILEQLHKQCYICFSM